MELNEVFPAVRPDCDPLDPEKYQASSSFCIMYGSTAIEAVSRALVANIAGLEIEIPELLLSEGLN
jgi:hypothetical protein